MIARIHYSFPVIWRKRSGFSLVKENFSFEKLGIREVRLRVQLFEKPIGSLGNPHF